MQLVNGVLENGHDDVDVDMFVEFLGMLSHCLMRLEGRGSKMLRAGQDCRDYRKCD